MSAIISRLVYFNNNNFSDKYSNIFDIKELSTQLPTIKKTPSVDILKPKIKNLISIIPKIDKINYSEDYKSVGTRDFKYIIISTSNFSSIFLIADKRSNTIFVGFRGTTSLKSGLSYVKITSTLPFKPCSESDNGYLLGVFKITGETFYTVGEGIRFLSRTFLANNNFKLISTGHSLGGGCAQIFSYLWAKENPTKPICCITFGAPRVMNGPAIQQFIYLIKKKQIVYERIVTDGDPFPKLPPNIKGMVQNRNYYHIDDYDPKYRKSALFCTNYSTTKKIKCNLKNKNKTKRAKISTSNHGNYMSVNFLEAAQHLTDFKKEIKRDGEGNTICRIIVSGGNEPSKASFFNLNLLKLAKKEVSSNTTRKIGKVLLTDYKHPDIFMNSRVFDDIIKKSRKLNNNDLNPLSTDNYLQLDIDDKTEPREQLICL